MAKKGRDYEFNTKSVLYCDHLSEIKKRLLVDVGPYISLIRQVAKDDKKGIGYFSSVRMLFPIVESLATFIKKEKQELLRELGVPYPYLYWSLFRDVFVHGDEFATAKAGTVTVAPALGISHTSGSGSHTVTVRSLMLDVCKLYDDLVRYIDNLLVQGNDEQAEIVSEIEYFYSSTDDEVKKIISEIEQMSSTS